MQAKTERFEMRLEQDEIDSIDRWRGKQPGVPSRAEAVRQLIQAGLATSASKPVKISDGEKLILFMLGEVHRHLKTKGEMDPAFIDAAILGGHYWALKRGLIHDYEDSDATVREVIDILDMWSFLEGGFAKLPKKERDAVTSEIKRDGVAFWGFDGNNEGEHLGIAQFLTGPMKQFESFKGRAVNSHFPTLERYRRMLAIFGPMRTKLTGRGLSASEIIQIMKPHRG